MRSLVPEPEENRSNFEQSLQNILNNGSPNICLTFHCAYLPHPNFNSYFADVNGDGLPDLISANRPVAERDSENNPRTVCEDGHQIHLNRGYGFETAEFETFPHTWSEGNTASALYLVTNRDRFCAASRPRIEDRSAPMAAGFGNPQADLPKYPMAAMANTDINGDGRPDIVFAYQPSVHSAAVDQKIFVNTGRGFAPSSIQLPADVALARNMRPSLQPYPPFGLRVWPVAGLVDMARFVDLDNDGLVDIVRAGMCRALPPLGNTNCQPAVWYRNTGNLPDRLERISSTSGAWTSIEYAAPKSDIVHIPEDGLHPPATMRVVKTIRSASGPVPTPAGYDPFPVQEIRLSYDNFVKDLLSNEVLGFEKVVAEFVNSFNGMPRETVRVTRTFEVRPEIADVNGVVPSLRHPLKGALVSTHTIDVSSGHVSTDTSEYRLETRGNGVVIRPRREIHGEVSPSGAAAYTADETVSFDAYGNPTERVSGNWDGAAIAPVEQRRTTGAEYENRTTGAGKVWQLGLVTREQSLGYSEDIDGTVDPAKVLGETVTTYDATGLVSSTKRMNIRAPGCAGLADDETTYEYFAHGLVKKTHDTAGFAAPGGNYLRDVTFTYEAQSLYVASASTNVGRMNGASFQPVATTLNVAFLTDLRHGKTTKTTDPNGAATFATYDSTGRVLTRKGADNVVLESNVYVDAFPVSQTSTITTDVSKTFLRYTQLDADDHVLAVLEAPPSQSTWARKTKVRLDAFGRPVESFLTASVVGIQGGVGPATGPKDVTTFDGFDRTTQVVAADGTTTSSVYEPRQTTETDARATQTARVYDSFGELVSVERNVGGAAGETSSHSFIRDGRGDIVRVTDGDGSVRRIERDGGGRVRHVTLPHQPGATPGRFTMCHDVADKLVSLVTPAGRNVAIIHDQLGRTLKTTATDANGLTVTTSQVYDSATAAAWGLGRLAQKNDESGIYNIKYDSYGRLKNVAYSPSVRAKAGATNVGATYTADFAYTPANLLKSVNFYGLPSAASLTYTRDMQGRAKIVDTKVGTTNRTLVADVTYDQDDRITVARYGNGTSGEWTFNPLSRRLDRIAYKTSSSAVLAAVGMTYDPNDNLLAESRERQGVAGIFSQKLHSYDPLDRLRTSDVAHPGGNQSESYTFSASGNIVSAGTDAYTYGSEVTSQAVSNVADIWGQKQRALGYDADGYLATDQETRADGSSSTRSLEFDPTGCMRSITREDLSAGGTTTSAASEYTCGLDGKVVARDTMKLDGGRSRRIDFAGLAEIRPDEGIFMLRVPLSGTVSVEDARSLATGARVTAMSGYVLSDARGSVLATTGFDSASPGFTREADYDAWGKKLAGYSALSAPRHGFVGAEVDAAAGTYSFGARTYDPSLRRWVSPDPLLGSHPSIDEDGGEGLNLYAYADGNPVKNTDKTGFCVPCAIVAGAATILGMGMSAPSDTKQAPAS